MKLGLRQPPRARAPSERPKPVADAQGPVPPVIADERYDFSAGPSMRVEKHVIGHEANPILVVDGLLANPASAVDFAEAEVNFVPGPTGTYFPGLRGRRSDAYVATFLDRLGPAMRETFGLRDNVRFNFNNLFSLTTTPGSELRPLQKVPHVDHIGPRGLAVVHFIFAAPLGGTGFFRHKATGWETITEERAERYDRMVAREIEQSGTSPGYLFRDSPHFDLVFNVEPAMDRLVIFSGHQLHSATVPDGVTLPTDVRQGRLTINSFIGLR